MDFQGEFLSELCPHRFYVELISFLLSDTSSSAYARAQESVIYLLSFFIRPIRVIRGSPLILFLICVIGLSSVSSVVPFPPLLTSRKPGL